MDGLEMDEPKDNYTEISFECEVLGDKSNCIGYANSNGGKSCKYRTLHNECLSQIAQVNRMVIELKQRGIK